MWFKNLLVYRLNQWTETPESLTEKLSRQALQPCSGMDMQNRGWLPPKGENQPIVHASGQQMMISLGVEKKLLPSTVINQFAKARAVDIEEQQGYKPGRKQMKEIKEAITDELLPRAFAIRRKTYVWIDPVNRFLVIDAASIAKADEVVEMLHKTIDGIALAFIKTQMSPSAAMTVWLSGSDTPSGFTIDQDCELRGRGDAAATVRYVRHTLDDDEVKKHIKSGKEVTKLGLTWNDRISFVLHENLQLKRIAPLDSIKPEAEESDAFDADFYLMTTELNNLLPAVFDILGGEVQSSKS
jgi:recombination associated protein RdgC